MYQKPLLPRMIRLLYRQNGAPVTCLRGKTQELVMSYTLRVNVSFLRKYEG